jgi:ATP-binding cassette subfamily F protein uup
MGFAYEPENIILRDVDVDLGPGDRVGVVGANGSGKSTFVKLLAARLEPTTGTVKTGPTVVSSYLDQGGGDFDLDATVQELVAGPHGIPGSLEDLALMKRFWFTGALPVTRAKDLSGGERRRLQLLLALAARPNVLFLDEPTNDLDLATLRLIEEALVLFAGCVIVVSHDRYFLNRVCTHTLAFEADGKVSLHAGNYEYYLEKRAARRPSLAPPARASKPAARRAEKARKLSYKEAKELETIEAEILASESEAARIEAAFAAPRDGLEWRALEVQLQSARENVVRLYDRWEELERIKSTGE